MNMLNAEMLKPFSWRYLGNCVTSVVIFNTPWSFYAYVGWNRSFRCTK